MTLTELNGGGGPAFPRDHQHDGHNGMDLRDYFAAKAMVAIITMPMSPDSCPEAYDYQPAGVAKSAYEMADAMLRAREPQ
jgi:hypothetical protein